VRSAFRNQARTGASRLVADYVAAWGSGRAAARRVALGCSGLALLCAVLASACGSNSVHSPFTLDAGSEAGAAGASSTDGGLNIGNDAGDPTLGGPCADDSQCDDAIPCTADRCDAGVQRCRHSPDDSQCADDVYCNGEEVCDPKLGCHAGPPVACADSDPCTIDTCVEDTHSCTRVPRDADADGDPVWNCTDGGDCDDTNPSVSSHAAEVCGNAKDDNCDGQVDEASCVTPEHDRCADALVIAESGLRSLSLAATKLDYPTECAPAGPNLGDIVVALKVPAGPAQDIDVVAQTSASFISLAAAAECGKALGLTCAPSVSAKGGALTRLHFYGLAPGVYPLYVAGSAETDVALSVTFSAASVPPSNETCGTAAPIAPGESQQVALVLPQPDLSSACGTMSGELVYSFTLQETQDVRVFASPLQAYGIPQISLRTASCTAQSSELTCRIGAPSAALFARALPAGKYYLSVSATGPVDLDLRLEESAPSAPLADEGCADSPAIVPGETSDLQLADHVDAVATGCLAGAPDSTHSLTLTQATDVLLVERISKNDTGAVSLAGPSCAEPTRLACGSSGVSPVRAAAYAVPPGTYRAVAESAAGNPVTLTAFTRKAVPVSLVALADDCSAPFEIPAGGGRFKGNTANAHADFSAGCDVGSQPQYGAPDQLLHLRLKTKSRVVLDMSGSGYSTMLSVRRGATCPGTELPLSCAAGYAAGRSFLDLDLGSGDYYVQVDGYAGDAGAWSLDVYVTPDTL